MSEYFSLCRSVLFLELLLHFLKMQVLSCLLGQESIGSSRPINHGTRTYWSKKKHWQGWTFPTVIHYLLLCDRWQLKGNLTGWHLTRKCIWSKGVELSSFHEKKMVPADIHWRLLNVYGVQIVDVNTAWQWVTSAGTDFYRCNIQVLVHCWKKYKASGGACVE